MPPKKRKASFSPVEEHIGSPTKKRAYKKRIPAATAATSRPKRGETEESVEETNRKPATPHKRPYKKTGNVGRPKSKSTTSTSSRPSSSLSSKASTAQVIAKRGRGRPKKVVNDESARTSETPLKIPVKPQEEAEKKRVRGRPKKAMKESSFVKGTSAIEPQVPIKSQGEIEDYSVDYGEEDLKDNRSYWLMKAEPETRFEKGVDVRFSIDDLRGCPEPEPWDGVRNPGARNNMRAMRKGDYAFFYHSNCKVPGIAGVMEIVQEHSVDVTAFDTSHPYHDPRSDPKNPKWDLVHVEFRRKFKKLVGLAELKTYGKPGGALEGLQMLKQSRLSVSAVTVKQWKFIMSLVGEDDDDEQESEGS